ncbi:MAG: biotin transporter BioY [Sulfolobales archaeon]
MGEDKISRKSKLKALTRALLKSDKLIYLESNNKWLLVASGDVKGDFKLLSRVATISFGVLLMAISSRISLITPFSEVPFTFQTLALITLLLLLRENAWKAISTYLMLGFAGLPLFAYGGGLQYLMSPTAGYLIGFLISSILGYLVGNSRSFIKFVLLSFSSLGIIYFFGWLWLTMYYTVIAGLVNVVNSMFIAFIRGVLPFVIWDVMKALIASLISYEIYRSKNVFRLLRSLLSDFLR